ncbi:MAG: flagellar export chaperone FliS [Phycisphaeraceae bacterium]|nr:flagellar export chaperone FliS [Phycisphaeraceae bacterium]
MNPTPTANPYLRNQVLSAKPEELRLMLFDGAIRFLSVGRKGLESRDYDISYTNISKAQKIVLELSNSLNRDVMPEVTEKLSALYTFIYRLLVDASTTREIKHLDEAIRLLKYERETWALLIEKAAEQPAGNGAA